MSKFLEIQNAIKSLGPGEYQRFCSEYSTRKFEFSNIKKKFYIIISLNKEFLFGDFFN